VLIRTCILPYLIRRSDRPFECPVDCGKTADCILMPFGVVDRLGLTIAPWEG